MPAVTTTAEIAEAIRGMLNNDWQIHVDEIRSYQIPGAPCIRRAKNEIRYRVFVLIYKPVCISAFLSADTLPQLKKKIDAGDLWDEIRKEFEKKAVKMSPEELAKLGITRPGIGNGQRQLALTHKS